jgi:hypothetical protein
MLENPPNNPNSDKNEDKNPLVDYTPKFVNGAGLPGGMRWNDLGLDHVPLPPPIEDAKDAPIKTTTPSTPEPKSLWASIKKFIGQ